MASYTKLNLKVDVEDQAPKFGFSPNLEFRLAGDPLAVEQSALRAYPARKGPEP